MTQRLISLTDHKAAKAQGVPVDSTDRLRWRERTADERGLSPAFVRIGRRLYVCPQKFHELARRQSA